MAYKRITMKSLLFPALFFFSLSTHAQSWFPVGSPGFSDSTATYTCLAIGTDGTPYVVYQDAGHNNKATVMKYSGGGWVNVGNPGFSAGKATGYNNWIAIDKNGTPYVVYEDNANGNRATVMKFDGSSWVPVGSPGFSAGAAGYTTIAIDSSGTPYVGYADGAHNSKATAMKFNGSSWVPVGAPGLSDSAALFVSIAINDSGTPYMVYEDIAYNGRITVMKYNGTAWVNVGSIGDQ